MRCLRASFVAASALVFALIAPVAHAAFPGANGKIAFNSDRNGGNLDIYSMNSNGSQETRLTTSPAIDVTPAWSPDGAKIAFVSDRDGQYDIYTMNADGTGQTRITTNSASDVAPAWSPDGTKIVFSSTRDGNGEIYTMNANGTSPVRLTNNAASDGYASWSSQNNKIAFQTNRDGNWEIYTMNVDGTGQVNRTNNAAYDEFPDWSPDGTKIVFDTTREPGGDFDFYTMNADGSSLIPQSSDSNNQRGASWAPEGGNMFAWGADTSGNYDIVTSTGSGTSDSAYDEYPDWQPLANSYVRPTGASPLRVPLVPAYRDCWYAQTTHQGSLSRAACYAPEPRSDYLTVGTPDVNGQATNASGYVKIAAFCNGGASGEQPPCLTTPGDQLDGSIFVTWSDVRCAGTSGGCSNGALSDYTGNLRAEVRVRITDKNVGPAAVGPSKNGTTSDFSLDFNVPCSTTPATTVGATCSVTTSIDALLGGSAVVEQKRAIWQLTGGEGGIRLLDGGPDGVAQTADNTLFASTGLYFP